MTAAGGQRVNLNFMISPGTDYQLGIKNGETPDMYRNNSGPSYPYTIAGVASITRSSFSEEKFLVINMFELNMLITVISISNFIFFSF